MQLFKSSKEIEPPQRNGPDILPEECAMIYVERSIKNIPDKFWTSTELHKLYKGNRKEKNKRSRFLTKLIAPMKIELYVFISRELAGIVMLKEKPCSIYKIVFEDHNEDYDEDDDDDDDDDDDSIQHIANRIKEESKKIKMTKIKTEYKTIKTENLFDECWIDRSNSNICTYKFVYPTAISPW